MQFIALHLARVFYCANLALALTSPWIGEPPSMLSDPETMGDSGMVTFQFEPMDPQDVFNDQSSEEEAFYDSPPGSHGHKSIFDEAANGHSAKTFSAGSMHPKDMESFFDDAMSTLERESLAHQGDRNLGPDDLIMMSEPLPNAASIPASTLRSLFPGPGFIIEEDDAPPMAFGKPDMAVMDMLGQMDPSFAQDLLPIAHRAAGAGHKANSCEPDVREYCRWAPSHLHCLGQNSDKISDKCREDIGKSVPFACSSEIDKWCNILEKGILDCLGVHLKELQDDCHDAVVATHHVISKAKTHKASVTDPVTGTQKVNVPSQKQTPKQREANIDAQLGKKTPDASAEQIDKKMGDIAKEINSKVIEKMVPKISAQAEQKAESEWRDKYMQLKAELDTKIGDTAKEINDKVIAKMVPKISAQAEQKAESDWRDKYMQLQAEHEKLQADYAKLKGTAKSQPVTANITSSHKADMLATNRSDALKSDKASEIKEFVLSQAATIIGLSITAAVSLLMLRSQHISKLLAKHCEPLAAVPLVKPRSPCTSEVDRFVVAPGSQQTPTQ
jgi:hypothetical protein